MGETNSKLDAEKSILKNPVEGEASDFYWACRNGDLEHVKQLLPTIEYNELNCLEPNGSTALHAAAYYGHTEIVRLLLHVRGCKRDQRNRYGLTAYEEANSSEMRELFHRPQGIKNRFCDQENNASKLFEANTHTSTSVVLNEEESVEVTDDGWIYCVADQVPDDRWIGCCADERTLTIIRESLGSVKGLINSYVFKTFIFLCQSRLVQYLISNQKEQVIHPNWVREMIVESIKGMIETEVPNEHLEFKRCSSLIDEYVKYGMAENLLRLYTLETPLYEKLHENASPLFVPLLLSLDQFQNRYFQGESYRGLAMSEDDLRVYRWALKSKGVVMTTTFCSTSLNIEMAKAFAKGRSAETNSKQSVLMVFHFNKKYESAINLCKLSDTQPCISAYEDEEEVLLLPCTLFTVTRIETGPTFQTIYLENVSEKSMSFLSALKWLSANRDELGLLD